MRETQATGDTIIAGTYTNLNYHLVFSTKNRERYIDEPEFERRLHEYLAGTIRGKGGVPYLINGTQDHVHLLIRWIPNGNLSVLLRDMKSQSSKWVHATFGNRRRFAWQEGFGAFTVSCSQTGAVREYIASQKEHHRTCGFKPEFRGLLKAHDIEYDEETIWL